ncbi:DNA oxidative demethylase AlkB [Sphingomonas naphthae]|uniref:DNA oxidative demethylase AlkB n=1 Tax=Sphingomonas naphthae TaxID=1813468 RepID=A0ABY7TRW5_9SPHN|nr:DNA oxidative demethylase AlkB [Sphingomonas naphthae]WCT74589.1 DNA oxidative demethylase AlkB [Sphingomonas naphthae]
MIADLFAESRTLTLDPGAMLLGGFALGVAPALLEGVAAIAAAAPFRQMATPGGRRMSVAMTNCGAAGWVTDAAGYRYATADPLSGRPWPAMPPAFRDLARRAATAAGFAGFDPDACLVNLYRPGARMAPHQDIDERDMGEPIVSVSLGLSATFLWGGAARGDPKRRLRIDHGDVLVWGGPARRTFHGIAPLAAGTQPDTGETRINLTFRRAL